MILFTGDAASAYDSANITVSELTLDNNDVDFTKLLLYASTFRLGKVSSISGENYESQNCSGRRDVHNPTTP